MINPLDQEILYKLLDEQNILEDVYHFPEHIEQTMELGIIGPDSSEKTYDFKHVVYCGMGGSGISGDLIASYLEEEIKVPFIVNKGYRLPNFVNEDTLVICVSYSGNTEETIETYKAAKARKATVAVVTGGGKLYDLASAHGDSIIKVLTDVQQPRAATGFLLFSALKLLDKYDIISLNKDEVISAIELLKRMRDEELGPKVPTADNIAKEIATEARAKLFVIYGSEGLTAAAATRWKEQFNEMAKNAAYTGIYPQINHNELVSFGFPHNVTNDIAIISLRSDYDHARNKLRMDITEKELIPYDVAKVIQVNAWGKGRLAQLLSLTYIGDYTAVYTAIMNHTNPSTIDTMVQLKEKLSQTE